MQLSASPNAEPLVEFFLDVISMAPGVCVDTADPPAAAAAAATATEARAAAAASTAAAAAAANGLKGCDGGRGPQSSALHALRPPLFDFIAFAARLLLQQHTSPAAVAAALQEHLLGGPQDLAGVYGEVAAFKAVAAAVLQHRDMFAALSGVYTPDDEQQQQQQQQQEQQQQKQQRQEERHLLLLQFEAWKQQQQQLLQLEKAQLLLLLRLALTGKETGPPLLQQVINCLLRLLINK